MANDRVRYIRCTNGFFAGHKGQVYIGEYIMLPVNEAMDITAGGKGESVTEGEYASGPKAFDVNNSIRRALKAEEAKATAPPAAPDSDAPGKVTGINRTNRS